MATVAELLRLALRTMRSAMAAAAAAPVMRRRWWCGPALELRAMELVRARWCW